MYLRASVANQTQQVSGLQGFPNSSKDWEESKILQAGVFSFFIYWAVETSGGVILTN